MRTFWQDLRFGLRTLGRSPGLVAVAVMSLALGISANSVIFSIVDGIVLRPWPIEQPDQLVKVFTSMEKSPQGNLSFADYADLRGQCKTFSGLLAYQRRGALLETGTETEMLLANVVSENYFTLLGVKAARGRTVFSTPKEGTAADPEIVISYGLWQRRFGGDPNLPGKTIELSKRHFVVAGIAPQYFRGLEKFLAIDVWFPVETWLGARADERADLALRDRRDWEVLGRLAPGASVAAARAEVETVARRLADSFPATNKAVRFHAVFEPEFRTRNLFPFVALLLCTVGLVLLICCANVAGLLLAKAETRRREIAIRAALGASHARILRQLLTESALLTLLGTLLALLFTAWLIELFPALLPAGPFSFDVRLEGRALAFTLFVSVLSTLIFGIVPALQATRVDLVPVLKGTESGLTGSRRLVLRNLLVVAQVSISFVLLATAGLLLHSYVFIRDMNPGFDTGRNLLIMEFYPTGHTEGRQTLEVYSQLVERIEALPGVKRATFARRFHLSGSGGGATVKVRVPGFPLPPEKEGLDLKFNIVGPNYFQTVGTRILRGRDFQPTDGPQSSKVILVSETMARQFWPNEDPVGKWMEVLGAARQIVGVTQDSKINSLDEPPEPYLYLPFAQNSRGETKLIVETAGDPSGWTAMVRREMRAVSPGLPLLQPVTLKQQMRNALYQYEMPAQLTGSLGLLGMFLAAVGLYGVVAYAVSRRQREIGIRIALGAQRSDVLKMVLRHGLGLSALGVLIGFGAAVAVTRAIPALVRGVSPNDPAAFLGSAGLVLLVTLVASYLPARRATKVDPLVTLRFE